MLWLKSCPKCKRGDLVSQRDIYGSYLECIQCGYTVDLPTARRPLVAVAAPAADRREVAAHRR